MRGTRLEATKALAALITEVGDGGALPRQSERSLTVEELVRWYLQFATEERGLEHSTMLGYETAYDNWVSDMLGTRRASTITPGDLDTLFGRMRRAGLSRSRMNNVRSVLSGAYKWGKRHRKVTTNPVQGFDLPVSTHTPRPTTAPELGALLHVLDIVEQHDPVIAPVLKLGATTGLRRGELAGLRRDRVIDTHSPQNGSAERHRAESWPARPNGASDRPIPGGRGVTRRCAVRIGSTVIGPGR